MLTLNEMKNAMSLEIAELVKLGVIKISKKKLEILLNKVDEDDCNMSVSQCVEMYLAFL